MALSLYHYDPESKQQSMCWKKPDEAPPTKFRKSRSAGKVLMSIFWDARGVLLTKFINKGETINADYHAQLLVELREAIKQKRRGMISRGILLLQDNAPAHTAHTAHTSTSAAEACGIELLPHPPYSPDLAPSDLYMLLRNVEWKYLIGLALD